MMKLLAKKTSGDGNKDCRHQDMGATPGLLLDSGVTYRNFPVITLENKLPLPQDSCHTFQVSVLSLGALVYTCSSDLCAI